jgi:hypothetical protein
MFGGALVSIVLALTGFPNLPIGLSGQSAPRLPR